MILIGFGSNMPFCGRSPEAVVSMAIQAVGRVAELQGISKLYRSPAWPDSSEPAFVNAVCLVRSDLSPQALLEVLHAIEAGFGRRRSVKNAPRTLDLDLLAFDDLILASEGGEGLVLPHPGIAARDFVLAPLCDIAPDWRHPVGDQSATALLKALDHVTAAPIDSGPAAEFFAPQQL